MTSTKTSNRDTANDENNLEPKPRRLDLSATQLIAGALAAMTSAVIGAQLGVAGTVLGAALASVVAGVAGTLYTASLRHTKTKLGSVIVSKVGDTEVELTPVSEETVRLDRPASDPLPQAAAAPPSLDPVAQAADLDRTGEPASRFAWKPILISTAAVFLLAIAGITGFELVSGQAISGGDGTTITQVGEGRAGPQTPTDGTDTSAEPTTEPSASSEPTAPAEPSTGESAEPTTPTEPEEPSAGEPTEPLGGDSTPGGEAGDGDAGGEAGAGDGTGTDGG